MTERVVILRTRMDNFKNDIYFHLVYSRHLNAYLCEVIVLSAKYD